MKKLFLIFGLLNSLFSALSFSGNFPDYLREERGLTGNVMIHLGMKSLDEKDWPQVDSQFSKGVSVDLGEVDWPFFITLGFISSKDKESESRRYNDERVIEGQTEELRLGIKYTGNVAADSYIYLSGGFAKITAAQKVTFHINQTKSSFGAKNSALGGWIATGVSWVLAGNVILGGDISYSIADVQLESDRLDINDHIQVGGINYLMSIGYHW